MWGRSSFRLKAVSLREAVARAIDDARRRLGDPLARVAFVVPSRANAEQIRRLLIVGRPGVRLIDRRAPLSWRAGL